MATMGRPKLEEPATIRLNLRFTEREYARVQAYADRHGIPKARAIKECFMERMEQEEAALQEN